MRGSLREHPMAQTLTRPAPLSWTWPELKSDLREIAAKEEGKLMADRLVDAMKQQLPFLSRPMVLLELAAIVMALIDPEFPELAMP